jgi:ABC-type multidrug transport system ATPase subunit
MWVHSALVQGLDPASRRTLWEVVKNNKRDRAIVLTTHSMEEAELLCDRLGIFVDGRLVCVGHPKDITSRHGSFLVRGHMFGDSGSAD